MVDALQLKEKIISIIHERGPMMPSQIAKEVGLSILFSSAFLSELYNEKRLNMSHLRIGSSPLYFLSGQEPQMEKFSHYLKSKEKDAFAMLKENKYLEDKNLHPAIRVALREIKDYAIPFKKDEEICWKYFTISDEEIRNLIEGNESENIKEKIKMEISGEEVREKELEKDIIEKTKRQLGKIEEEPEEISKTEKEETLEETIKHEEKTLDIFDNKKTSAKKENKKTAKSKTSSKKTATKKKDENFFNKVKEFLAEKKIEIIDIIDFKNDEAKIKIKKDKSEELLFVFNKKKITEEEIIKSGRDALKMGLKYRILSFGEPAKKLGDFISAIKNLSEIGKIN